MKKLILLFFLTSSFELFACKILPPPPHERGSIDDTEFLSKFLSSAKNIYVGKIVNDNREFRRKPVQVFKVKKIWKSDVPDINAQEWFKREMQIQNKRYGENDFVSSVSGGFCGNNHYLKREEIPNKYYLYLGTTSIQYTIPIEKAKALIMKLKNVDTRKNINPSWQFCESDNQCVKAGSKCSISLNKDYVSQFNTLLKTVNDTHCNANKIVTSKCVEWFCE